MPQIKDFGPLNEAPAGEDFIATQTPAGVSSHSTILSIHEAIHQANIGWWNYHPSDFQVARTYSSAGGWTKIANDGAGPAAQYAYRPSSVVDLFDTTNGQLDFSGLAIGDTFEFRIDLDISTTVANQEVLVRGEFGIGGTPYTVSMASLEKKTAGTYQLSTYRGGPIASENTRANPAELQLFSTSDFTYSLQMMYYSVTRR